MTTPIDTAELRRLRTARDDTGEIAEHTGDPDDIDAADDADDLYRERVEYYLPQLLDAADERDRLRKLFTDAGQGEHNVLALIDHYQAETRAAEAALDEVGLALSGPSGCPPDVVVGIAVSERARHRQIDRALTDAVSAANVVRAERDQLRVEVTRLREALVAARADIREMAGGDPWSGDGDSPEQKISDALEATKETI